ncbi:MAG: M48 family metalloprotease [Prolixibacteraceae bacterium]|nr:M48 family metalloprotease [Prolixibacteraceae bacterium]
MKALFNFFSPEMIEALGWTIVHSLWQGLVVTLAVALLLILLRKNSAQIKYFISFVALVVLLAWSGTTFIRSYNYANEKTRLKEQITNNPAYLKLQLEEKLYTQNAVEETTRTTVNMQEVKIRSFFQRNFYLICSLWIIGVILLTIRLTGGFIYAYRLRTYRLSEMGEKWLAKIDEFSEKLQIRRKVEAFFSPLAKGPVTLGALKPVLLFPVSAFTGLSSKEIEAIIAHELAHVLRHDYLFNIIQSLVEIIFFYHPGVWIISAQIRNERENSCDNIAIELTGDKVSFAKALAAMQIKQMEQEQLAMAFASSKGNILQRIKRIQKQVAMKTNFIEGLIAAAVVVLGLTLASFTMGNENAKPDSGVQDETVTEIAPYNVLPEVTVNRSKQEIDSIRMTFEENISKNEEIEQVSEEVEKMVEIALSETDEALSAEMMEQISEMLSSLDIDGIIASSMREASRALSEIDLEEVARESGDSVDYDEIRREIEEARKEIKEARREAYKEMEEARREAHKEMEEARREALEELDSEDFRHDMAEARRDIEEARREIEEARREMEWEMRHDMENDHVPEAIIELSIDAAQIGLDAAAAVLENLDIEHIVECALEGVEQSLEALDEIDFDSLEKNHELTEEEIEDLKQELKWKEEKLQMEKEKIKQKEKELKKKKREDK